MEVTSPRLGEAFSYWPSAFCGLVAAVAARRFSHCNVQACAAGAFVGLAGWAIQVICEPPPEEQTCNAKIRAAALRRLDDLQRRIAAAGEDVERVTPLVKEMWAELAPYKQEPWYQRLKESANALVGDTVGRLRAASVSLEERPLTASLEDHAQRLGAAATALTGSQVPDSLAAELRQINSITTRLREEARLLAETALSNSELERQRAIEEADKSLENLLLRAGKQITNVSDDGNCLFAACSTGALSTRVLRGLVVAWLRENPANWSAILGEETVEQYCGRMAKSGEFGTEVEIRAIAEVKKRRVRVYAPTTSGPMDDINGCYTEYGSGEGPPIEILFKRSRSHYLKVSES